MHAYLLALEIEPVEVNKTYVALPLHCTVMPWFFLEKAPAEVVRAITPVISSHELITLVSGAEDFFGHDRDIPVNRIANEEAARKLHTSLLDVLQIFGPHFKETQWISDGYTPHVTRQRSGRFETGQQSTITKVYLAEAVDPEELTQKNIVTRINLGKSV